MNTRKLISCTVLLCCTKGALAQEAVVRPPEFPGGKSRLYKHISDNVYYPDKAQLAKMEGTVYVFFAVRKDGMVTNVTVRDKAGFNMDNEAMRVIKAMPRWKPAFYKGKPIDYVFCAPVRFSLKK